MAQLVAADFECDGFEGPQDGFGNFGEVDIDDGQFVYERRILALICGPRLFQPAQLVELATALVFERASSAVTVLPRHTAPALRSIDTAAASAQGR